MDSLNFLKEQNIPDLKCDPLRYILKKNLLDDSGLVLEFGT
tara:strand:- start:226 stop:348 length:123 start_codon:yes stop_codon:yes gene_type:complete